MACDEPMSIHTGKPVLGGRGAARAFLLFMAGAAFVRAEPGGGVPPEDGAVVINVDCGTVVNTMRGGIGASWQAPPNKSLSIGPGLAAVRKALDKRGMHKLLLAGPDVTCGGFPAKTEGI